MMKKLRYIITHAVTADGTVAGCADEGTGR